MDIVDLTLKLWRSTPFEWGMTDCMLSVGDYVAQRGGKDVTTMFRGLYDSEAQAMAHMYHFGGVGGMARLAGLQEIDGPPERGDIVALATADPGDPQVGAICTGDMVAGRLERGVVEVLTRLVKIEGVWRCPA